MATSPQQQVPNNSIDLAGLSVTLSNRTAADPRAGSGYDIADMAAAVPVALYPFGAGTYILVNSRRWTAATPSGTATGFYTAWSENLLPSWFLIDGATGVRSRIHGDPTIPMQTANSSRTLTAVEHRSPDFLYLLNDVVNAGTRSAVVQVWHTNTFTGAITSVAEETIPVGTNGPGFGPGSYGDPGGVTFGLTAGGDPHTAGSTSFPIDFALTAGGGVWRGTDTVVFNKGINMVAPYMYFYGAGSATNAVYMARKPWGQLGATVNPSRTNPAPHPYWEFWSGTGWTTDDTFLGPIQTTAGPMTTFGPISVAQYGVSSVMAGAPVSHTLLSTVQAAGTARTAQVYTSLANRPWAPAGTVPLGTVGDTYLGGTLQFQPVLGVNPTLVNSTSSTAIPHLTAAKATTGAASRITVAWDCWQVPRYT